MADLPIVRNVPPKKRGDTWWFIFRIWDVDNSGVTPVKTVRNMTGATAKLVIRQTAAHTATLIAKGTLVSSGGELTAGLIKLRVAQADTASVTPTAAGAPYAYDAEVTHGGDITTWYTGEWPVLPEVALAAD